AARVGLERHHPAKIGDPRLARAEYRTRLDADENLPAEADQASHERGRARNRGQIGQFGHAQHGLEWQCHRLPRGLKQEHLDLFAAVLPWLLAGWAAGARLQESPRLVVERGEAAETGGAVHASSSWKSRCCARRRTAIAGRSSAAMVSPGSWP